MSRVSLIVPTLNAEKELPALLDSVMGQSRIPDDILIVDSTSDDNTVKVAKSYPGVQVIIIRREDFDHGGTRQLALESVIASPVVPTVASSLEGLGDALSTGGAAAAASTFVSFAATPIYLGVLRSRDASNKETSGFTLSMVAMLVAVAVFSLAVVLLAGPLGLVG